MNKKSWLGLEEDVVIVTGGSSGIGAAVIKGLLEANVSVLNADLVEGKQKDEKLFFVKTDITKAEDVAACVKACIDKFGKVTGIVNNAGINIPRLLVDAKNPGGLFELDTKIFDKIMEINQKGPFLLAQAAGHEFVKAGFGVIINMSSECGLEGSEGQSPYAATKAALNSFTRSWAKELGKYNIRVVGVAPGIMEETGLRTEAYETALAYTRGITIAELRAGYSKTSTTPMGRSGKLSEVADTVCYLLSNRASYITGVTINVAGGKTRG